MKYHTVYYLHLIANEPKLLITAMYERFCNLEKPEIYEIYMQNSRIEGIGKKAQL